MWNADLICRFISGPATALKASALPQSDRSNVSVSRCLIRVWPSGFFANFGVEWMMPQFSVAYAANAANWANGQSPGVS